MANSVLRVGLLPHRLWANEKSEGVDLSGLGADAGQLYPQPVPFWENAGTDAMQLSRKRMTIPGGRHRPSLNGQTASALDHAGEIEAGFTELYRLLQEHRESLLSTEGVLGRFDGDEIRVILRPTQAYATMLGESFHPDLLRDALDRDRFFDHLWVGATKRPACSRHSGPNATTSSKETSRRPGRGRGRGTFGATMGSGSPVISRSRPWPPCTGACAR